MSIRKQEKDILIFDDPLSMTSCHFNAIPTDQYLPDFRFWLKNPKSGLRMLNNLYEASWEVAKTQFLSNPQWKKKWIRNFEEFSDDDLKSHVIAGFNYPPSQYQLHLQFHLPPLLPFQYHLYLKGVHYTKGRFFPLEYAQKILELGESLKVDDETPIEEIVNHFEKKGVSYDQIYSDCFNRYGQSHKLLANYSPSDFGGLIFDHLEAFVPFKDKTHSLFQPKTEVGDIKKIQSEDKETLQNYGRPYQEGKPTGSYYKFAKNPSDLKIW